jgi:hypothetical protein
MKNRVAITRQALFSQPMQLRKQKRSSLLFRRRQVALVQLVEQFPVAAEKSPIEQS